MSSSDTDDLIFKALAHPRRRAILDHLKDEPRTTGMLCKMFDDLDRCTVMQHLKVLESADLIIVRRDGRERWNLLNSLPIKRIHDRWISEYASHAMTILDRLNSDLSKEP
ncbi:ArsR/SmtB family transcription factor [Brucella cytisi]|uniref:Transcriptional regulator n=1 Tax=Brucella cytisi TaxID=407152 RepID=A0A1J6HPM8_9HYPH|nr:metalloregulator ArsR/SmtB family transcription factor [Brucella cytisi]OIS94361.1 transcriptional regulator [Brucella cytisi]